MGGDGCVRYPVVLTMPSSCRALVLMSHLAIVACTGGASPPADAGAQVPCPVDPPADGAACSSPMSCHWLRCDAAGAVTATCALARWDVSSVPCPVDCDGVACGDGQICAIFQGGAQQHVCVDDPCDGAALEACLCEACPLPGEDRCAPSGFTVTCNTCAQAICP